MAERWLIGSAEDCDLVVQHPNVSAHHCRLTRTAVGWSLEDLRSSNGTFVNRVRVVDPLAVSQQDRITLGQSVEMPWPGSVPAQKLRGNKPPGIAAEHETSALQDVSVNSATRSVRPANHVADVTVAIRGGATVLGRDPKCDHVLDYPMVSWRHARIERDGASLFVEDLNSSNGTFVNGERICERTVVNPGDVVGLGSYRFVLTADGSFRKRDYRGDLTLEAQDIRVEVPGRRLLDEVSLTIYPSEFVGLMGPSGAGKSTLMSVLNGYSPPTQGRVAINGRNLYQHFDEFRGLIGFVPQDDIIHPELTVREALFYSARLRLPVDFSNRDIHKRIDDVLTQLGLTGIDDVLVGSPTRKGISGGQRKRVNLAMELLTDPSLLFLDEPTSGLSSEDTLIVMQVLRGLVDSGKTILLTIHQPSLEAFELLDNVVVIAKDSGRTATGRLAFYGPAYPDSVRFFNPQAKSSAALLTPDALLRGLATQPTGTWIECFRGSKFHREFVAERSGNMAGGDSANPSPRAKHEPGLTQWWTLIRRVLSIKLRDITNSIILLAQAPVIAILLVMVFGTKTAAEMTADNWASSVQATSITVFLMALAAIWFGCSNSVREIVSEWPIYVRERMVHLRIPWYIASKFTVLGGQCLVQCLILLGVVHWGSGLHGPWWPMFGLLLLASGVGLAIGLCISAIVKTSEVAIALLPLILLPMVILGGILQPQHEMNSVVRWCSNAMPSRWAFEGLLLIEAAERPKSPVMGTAGVNPPNAPANAPAELASKPSPIKPSVDIAETYFPGKTDRMGVRACAFALGAMFVLLVLTIQTALRLRDVH